jgi:hypothetical protein
MGAQKKLETAAAKRDDTPLLLVAGAVLLSALWLLSLRVRFNELNQDEFQHVHIAWNTLRGKVLYRDFYEHHGPLAAGFGAILLKLRGSDAASFGSFVLFRWVNFALVVAQAAIVYRLGRRLGASQAAGLLGAALLLVSGSLHWVGVQYRPDALQNLLMLGALWLLLERRDVLAGVAMGLMLGVNSKALLPMAALGAGVVAWEWFGTDGSLGAKARALSGRAWRMVAGAAAVLVVVAAALASLHALGDYVHHAWAGNFGLASSRASQSDIAGQTRLKIWRNDPWLTAGFALALVPALVHAWRARTRRPQRMFVATTAVVLLMVIFLPLRLYAFLMPLPLLALCAVMLMDDVTFAGRLTTWVSVGVAAGSTWMVYGKAPSAEWPTMPMQRDALQRALVNSDRDEPIAYVWPSRCGAYVFNADPDPTWMLTGAHTYDTAFPGSDEAFARVFREQVLTGKLRYLALEPQAVQGFPADVKKYLQAQFRPNGCLLERVR